MEVAPDIPKTQYAVQLVGPDELVLNTSKQVVLPRAHQILCRVEAVGLCFSDLKLLKQFSGHVRKGDVVSGIGPDVLQQIPSYVPGDSPTVPGHEAVVAIAAVGDGVEDFRLGDRYLVQTDYRWLRTIGSNAAFGYNFEGALQEYVLMDERVITSPAGQSMLIPVGEELSASAVAMVEPWACVENAYASNERPGLKQGGRLLVVVGVEINSDIVGRFLGRYAPGQITWVSKSPPPESIPGAPGLDLRIAQDLSQLEDESFDDVVYFGSDAKVVEQLFCKVATRGIFSIVLCGGKLGPDVVTPIGRIHYGGIRIVGTTGYDPCEAFGYIPARGEIRPGDKIHIVGAAGPMGMMHTIRSICSDVEGVSVFADDLDQRRLRALTKVAAPLARQNKVQYRASDAAPKNAGTFDYTVLMVPAPALVGDAVTSTAEGGVINIFAGIPATVSASIDLDAYIDKRLYFIGTSGSVLEDMERVLSKVQSGRLDTNVCVAAVSGLAGAVEGIRAVESRQIAGKIVVYPASRQLGLVRLEDMRDQMPQVAERLSDGLWNRQAEQALLQ
jgi:threonine dehydrogenase-like Zn-dependent dehydrogenase